MLIILVVDFKGFTKTSFISKLKEHPGKVHIAIVVGTRNVGHLKRRRTVTNGGKRQQYRNRNVFPVITRRNPCRIAQPETEVVV